jgi:hypothetical protein
MWSNRKVRFTVIVLVLVGANLGLWLSNRIFGYTLKGHAAVFIYLCHRFLCIRGICISRPSDCLAFGIPA